MRTLIAILLTIMAFACDKNNNETSSNSKIYNVDIDYQVFLKNSLGQNLLNPDVEGSYKHSEIMLYEDSLLSNKINDSILFNSDGNFFLRLFGGGSEELIYNTERIKYGTRYLKLNSSTIDTIYSETIYIGQSLLLNKVMYNSVVIFNLGDYRALTVIK
jgi:hypothetical protein